MKNIIAALTAFALLGFAVPAFACDGHKADKGEETTTTQAEKGDEHSCDSNCSHDKKKKKAEAEDTKEEGEV